MEEQLELLARLSLRGLERWDAFRQLLDLYAGIEPEAGELADNVHLDTFAFMFRDEDPQIRTAYIEAWISSVPFAVQTNSQIEELLEDTDASVRLAEMAYVCRLAEERKERRDAVFDWICRRVSDIDFDVRRQACEMLGEMGNVSLVCLKRSLDKASEKEAAWCEAGAFVLALEDQFQSIRTAAIQAICKLSIKNGFFANAAKPLILDTFNDESEDVRLLAVACLNLICSHHKLDIDLEHLESTMCLLDDSQADLRRATREVLVQLGPIDGDGLIKILRCLNAALRKYPEDLKDVLNCAGGLGHRYPDLVKQSLQSLLRIERFYMMPEPRLDDLYYTIKAVLVLNAANVDASLLADLPAYLVKHQSFFAMKYKGAVPSFRRCKPFYQTQVADPIPPPTAIVPSIVNALNAVIEGSSQLVPSIRDYLMVLENYPVLTKGVVPLLKALLKAASSEEFVSAVREIQARFWPLPPTLISCLSEAASSGRLCKVKLTSIEDPVNIMEARIFASSIDKDSILEVRIAVDFPNPDIAGLCATLSVGPGKFISQSIALQVGCDSAIVRFVLDPTTDEGLEASIQVWAVLKAPIPFTQAEIQGECVELLRASNTLYIPKPAV